MQTPNSILTLSKDFDYSELVRMNYDLRPVETCFIPFFEEAISVVEAIVPDAIFLHLQPSDFADCASFLKQLMGFQQHNPGYAPKVFVSEATATLLHTVIAVQGRISLPKESTLQQDQFIRLVEFSPEVLIEILDGAIESPQERKPLMNSIFSTINPFDSMVPALAC